MPLIPRIEYGGVAKPTGGAQATPEAFGSKVGEALGTFGKTVADVSQQVYDSYQEAQSANELTKAQKRLSDLTLQFKYGSTDEKGNALPPPDPSTHKELYQREVDSIRDEAGTRLIGTALNSFHANFNGYADRNGVSVQSNANDQMIAKAEVHTQEFVNANAEAYATETNPALRQALRGQVDNYLAKQREMGQLTDAKVYLIKKDWVDKANDGAIMHMINTNHEAALIALRGGEFEGEPQEKIEQFIQKAEARGEYIRRRENEKVDRAYTLGQREEAETQKRTSIQMMNLFNKRSEDGLPSSELSYEWLQQHRTQLGYDHYKYGLELISGKHNNVESNYDVLENLRDRTYKGEDVSDEAKKFAISGSLSPKHYDEIIFKIRDLHGRDSAGDVKGNGFRYINTTMVDIDGAKDPTLPPRRADAVEEYTLWLVEHPKHTPAEARDAYHVITDAWYGEHISQSEDARRVPDGLQRKDIHIKKDGSNSEAALKAINEKVVELSKLFQDKKVNQNEYERKIENLNAWARDHEQKIKVLDAMKRAAAAKTAR